MSETQTTETEAVAGEIKGILQRAADKWQVEVQPPGSNYTKKLWTKNPELVAGLSSRIGQSEVFQCNASYWTNNEGKQVRSLWVNGLGGEVAASAVAAPSPAQKPTEPEVDWDEKERRAIRSKAWAHTISLLGPHISGTDFDAAIAMKLHSEMKLMVELIYVDICRSHSFAHPNLGADVPLGDEPDVPFD